MRMNIGAIITEKRKEKKITQQALADFIGVTKASVSKWETGQTYPDITLLPLLAAYFDISIDSLLDYEPQLTADEIKHIYIALKQSFDLQPAEEVLTSIRSLIRRYYSCYPFILQMGLLIMNHYDLLPGENQEEKTQRYMNEAKELFIHVRTHTKDPELITEALKLEAYSLLILQEADQVLAILGEYVPSLFPVESLIAGAFQMKGEPERAVETMQSALLQYVICVMSLFTNYLKTLTTNPAKFTETVRRGDALIELFAIAKLNPTVVINFQLSCIFGYAQLGDEAAALDKLEQLIKILQATAFPVVLHGDDYFDQVERWFEQLEIGNQLPRDTMKVKAGILDLLIDQPLFADFEDQARLQMINQTLKQLRTEENQHA